MRVWQVFKNELKPSMTLGISEPFSARLSNASRAALRQLCISSGIGAQRINLSGKNAIIRGRDLEGDWYEYFIGQLLEKGRLDKALKHIKNKLDNGSLEYDSLPLLVKEIIKYSNDAQVLITSLSKANDVLRVDLSTEALAKLCATTRDELRKEKLNLARGYIALLDQDQVMKFLLSAKGPLSLTESMLNVFAQDAENSTEFISPDIPRKLVNKITSDEKIRELCIGLHDDIRANENIEVIYKLALDRYSKSCSMDIEELGEKISRASDLVAKTSNMGWHQNSQESYERIDELVESELDEFVIDLAIMWEFLAIKNKLPQIQQYTELEPQAIHHEVRSIASRHFLNDFDINLYALTQLIERTRDLSIIDELKEFFESHEEELVKSNQESLEDLQHALTERRQYLSGN